MGNCVCAQVKNMKNLDIPVSKLEELQNNYQKNINIYSGLLYRNNNQLNDNSTKCTKKFKSVLSNHSTINSFSSFINQDSHKNSCIDLSFIKEKKKRNDTPKSKINKYIPKKIKEELNNKDERIPRKFSSFCGHKSFGGPIFSKLCRHSKRNKKDNIDD